MAIRGLKPQALPQDDYLLEGTEQKLPKLSFDLERLGTTSWRAAKLRHESRSEVVSMGCQHRELQRKSGPEIHGKFHEQWIAMINHDQSPPFGYYGFDTFRVSCCFSAFLTLCFNLIVGQSAESLAWHQSSHSPAQAICPSTVRHHKRRLLGADLRGDPYDVILSIRLCNAKEELRHWVTVIEFDDSGVAHKPSTTNSDKQSLSAKQLWTKVSTSLPGTEVLHNLEQEISEEKASHWVLYLTGRENARLLLLQSFWHWQWISPCSADPLYSGPKLCS